MITNNNVQISLRKSLHIFCVTVKHSVFAPFGAAYAAGEVQCCLANQTHKKELNLIRR